MCRRVPTSPSPHVPTSPSPHVPESPRPRVPTSPRPHVPTSPRPRVPESPSPRVPTSPSPHVPTSPRPRVPTSQVPRPRPTFSHSPENMWMFKSWTINNTSHHWLHKETQKFQKVRVLKEYCAQRAWFFQLSEVFIQLQRSIYTLSWLDGSWSQGTKMSGQKKLFSFERPWKCQNSQYVYFLRKDWASLYLHLLTPNSHRVPVRSRPVYTIKPHLHEQFFLDKFALTRKNCSCKWGLRFFGPISYPESSGFLASGWAPGETLG